MRFAGESSPASEIVSIDFGVDSSDKSTDESQNKAKGLSATSGVYCKASIDFGVDGSEKGAGETENKDKSTSARSGECFKASLDFGVDSLDKSDGETENKDKRPSAKSGVRCKASLDFGVNSSDKSADETENKDKRIFTASGVESSDESADETENNDNQRIAATIAVGHILGHIAAPGTSTGAVLNRAKIQAGESEKERPRSPTAFAERARVLADSRREEGGDTQGVSCDQHTLHSHPEQGICTYYWQ